MAQELLKTYRTISDSRSLVESGNLEALSQFSKLHFEIEGKTIREVPSHDPKYQAGLLVEILHAQEGILPVQVLFSSEKATTWNNLGKVKDTGVCYRLNRLVLRPVWVGDRIEVCLGVTTKSCFSLIESPMKSPSVRLIRSQEGFKTPNSQSLLASSQKRHRVIPLTPGGASISSLQCSDFSQLEHIGYKYDINKLTQVESAAKLDGLVVFKSTEFYSQVTLQVRDRTTADTIKVYINYRPQDQGQCTVVNSIPLFARVSMINMKKCISSKLFFYLKGNLESADFRVVEPHEAVCNRNCPCHWRTKAKGPYHHEFVHEGQTYFFPIVHAPVTRIYISQISHTMLDRRLLEFHAVFVHLNYLKIECHCTTCNSTRSRRLGQCQECGGNQFKHNLKCCAVLADHSGVYLEVLCSFTAMARPVLQLTKELLHLLEDELVSQDVSELSYTKATLPGELQAHFEEDIELKTLTVIGQLNSPKVSYCREHGVLLNADVPLGTSYPLPSLQVYQVN
mmetsp:Transcript_30183/g.53461  ORF Transcript_30183/g.53461 Transcript_30183/m.53461 type:complete len:509 (-) Transcript_30183:304-1830(-)|eukprot:CAMPEP_0204910334 /NCGR_PEP_ID=MMETSP1397-20131031/8882_1 /ASSEMBLY_ACC=CAM_ASM_000891 /TAXON_ID=49980 /ORGANISM="Climacostomum Climacostomum virens, Strain Stock W-24" /LENGTH=508 /DNA_ID=CAMNT_0052080465 /DNA_START=462 /DNA_END=1988 /DNA_ORIENTATION=+